MSSLYCRFADCSRLFFLSLKPSNLVCICSTCDHLQTCICVWWVTKSQGLMGFQAAAQSAGKIRFLGGLAAGKGLCALLHRPAAKRGGERYQGSTRQAGYTFPSPCFFTFPLCFTCSRLAEPCKRAPLLCIPAHGSNLPVHHAKHQHVSMHMFEWECFQKSGNAGGKQLSLSRVKYHCWENWGKRKCVWVKVYCGVYSSSSSPYKLILVMLLVSRWIEGKSNNACQLTERNPSNHTPIAISYWWKWTQVLQQPANNKLACLLGKKCNQHEEVRRHLKVNWKETFCKCQRKFRICSPQLTLHSDTLTWDKLP